MARKGSVVSSRSMPRQAGLLRQVLSHTWLAVILMGSGLFLVTMIALAIGNERGFLAVWRMQRSLVQLANDIRMIEQDNRRLGDDIHRLRHDMGYIEKIAREDLGLIRPGELVFEFVE